MGYKDISDYNVDPVNVTNSPMNNTFLQEITDSDYTTVIIMEAEKCRVDLIATKYYNDENLYIFILWINNITDVNDLDAGNSIKIPTLDYIRKYYDRLKKERL